MIPTAANGTFILYSSITEPSITILPCEYELVEKKISIIKKENK
tara:strand:- start:51 stop:182 length:132 start_codon:yes stop_codon:yes gene_type:complete